MRVVAPTPTSNVKTEIVDDYQLCARCGEPLVTGENALSAPRLNSWIIYTHHIGPNCPPKAVRGWKAVRFADTVREGPNKETYRPGDPYYIGKSLRPCVCVLDDKHLKAELALVTYEPSDELNASTADLADALSHSQDRDSVEDHLNAAIDANNLGRTLELLAECLNLERRKSYLTLRTAPPVDPTPRCFKGVNVIATLGERRRKMQLPRADHVLTRDLKECPVEFPLYSNQKVFADAGKWVSEFECWSPKPEPFKVPYNSITHPKLFLWAAESLHQILEPVDSDNPYGPAGMLMRDSIEQVNAQRNDGSRCENIYWEEIEEAVPTPAGQGIWPDM